MTRIRATLPDRGSCSRVLRISVSFVYEEETPRESEPAESGGDGDFAIVSDTLRNRDIHDSVWCKKFGFVLALLQVPVILLGAWVFPPLAYALDFIAAGLSANAK